MAMRIDDKIKAIREELEKTGGVVVDTRQVNTNLAFLKLSNNFPGYSIKLLERRELGGKVYIYKN